MAKVPRIIKVPAGEAYVATENPLGEMGYYIVSQGRPRAVPGEDPHRELQQRLDHAVAAPGCLRARHHHDPGFAVLHPGGHRPMIASASRTGRRPPSRSGLAAVVVPTGAAIAVYLFLFKFIIVHAVPARPDGSRSARLAAAAWPRSASGCRRRTSSPTTRTRSSSSCRRSSSWPRRS